MIAGAYWDSGSGPVPNQDSLLLQHVVTENGSLILAAVCDGISGLAGGETASGYITERLSQAFFRDIVPIYASLSPYSSAGQAMHKSRRILYRTIYDSSLKLRQASSRTGDTGTTMSAALISKNTCLTINIGDSRIYGLNKSRIKQLTMDDVPTGEQSRDGCLTKAITSISWQSPSWNIHRLSRESGILLCTDGFYRSLDENSISLGLDPRKITDKSRLERHLTALGRKCLKNNVPDNISAVYVINKREVENEELL